MERKEGREAKKQSEKKESKKDENKESDKRETHITYTFTHIKNIKNKGAKKVEEK